MKISVGIALVSSTLTGAKLGRFYAFAESKDFAYFGTYQEGSPVNALSIPLSSSPQVARRIKFMRSLMLEFQDAFDKVMLSSDYDDFKAGRLAPIAANLYWEARKAIETRELR